MKLEFWLYCSYPSNIFTSLSLFAEFLPRTHQSPSPVRLSASDLTKHHMYTYICTSRRLIGPTRRESWQLNGTVLHVSPQQKLPSANRLEAVAQWGPGFCGTWVIDFSRLSISKPSRDNFLRTIWSKARNRLSCPLVMWSPLDWEGTWTQRWGPFQKWPQ